MLLAPGAGALAEVVQKDPLRLAQIVFEKPSVGASGVRTQANGAFANEGGTMNLVFVKPKGQALHGDDAQAFVDDAEAGAHRPRRHESMAGHVPQQSGLPEIKPEQQRHAKGSDDHQRA